MVRYGYVMINASVGVLQANFSILVIFLWGEETLLTNLPESINILNTSIDALVGMTETEEMP